MSLIKVSSSLGDYILINLHQVAWATIEAEDSERATRTILHMMDGTAFQLRADEAELVKEGLEKTLGKPPDSSTRPEN